MKNNKKSISFILVLTLLLTVLTSCGSNKDTPTPTNNDSAETTAGDNAEEGTTFNYSEGIDENGFWEGIKALDYVDIFDYKALSVPSNVHQVSEESIQAEVDSVLAYFSSSEQVTDRKVVDGDTVNIDFVGSVDGVEFDGGSTAGAGTDVTIGVTSYIDDFLEQLIGHMPGETINVEVTFPDVYQQESLQGKDAVFVTTINYIEQTIEPELTDDFINTNLSADYGWKTVADMKEALAADLQKGAIQQYVSEYMVNDVTVNSIPDKVSEFQENAMLQFYQDGADYYSMEFDDFLQSYVGVSNKEELIEYNYDSNMQNASYTLVAQSVAEDAGISISDEDMDNYFPDYSQYVESYGLPYLKQMVLFQKVVDYIIDFAVLE